MDSIKVSRRYIGVVDGLQTWEVTDVVTDEIIGFDQKEVTDDGR